MAMQYGLIFDVDGVIADTERVNAEASIQVFAELFLTPAARLALAPSRCVVIEEVDVCTIAGLIDQSGGMEE